jgi:ATP-dependent RNA helicase SUPV3L1/SUV3
VIPYTPNTRAHEGELHALLGPTNTGKTHRAIERMLDHATGMLGFPLRLLAREVYDRVSARLGEQAVALITGEEKRIPRAPRYYVCTVEAMPLDVRTEFVGVDEIQLVAHPERGHVFTDRLLHVRGTRETWFLGSDTAEWLLRRLLPDLRVHRLPRLSKLVHAGRGTVRTVPRRSAIVTFTMPAVYELADLLRVRRGGAAVVLGALSPRVRNAQVALYQAGEVDFLVATDAIGMGLNLDIDHVALAARSKFDGFETRPLEASELAQIVGRAGRHTRDGSFGTLSPEPELPPKLVAQLETHTFGSVQTAFYRNRDLDLSSLPALITSLSVRPPRQELRLPPDGDDLSVLRVFAKREDMRMRANTREAVQLAWDLCLIPNYEKLLPEHQAERLYPLFTELLERGRLVDARVHTALARLSSMEGDLYVLMDRLAGVRTWTYIAHQRGWLDGAAELRERTRALEEDLSDALHERLLARFVDVGRTGRSLPRVREGVAKGPFANLLALSLTRCEAPSHQERWVENVVDASFAEITIDPHGRIHARGERVGSLSRGPQLTAPSIKLRLPDDLDGGARARIDRRLQAHLRDVLAQLKLPEPAPAASAGLRGLAYQLAQGLGTVATQAARPQLDALSATERQALQDQGLVFGKLSIFLSSSLLDDALNARLALLRTWHDAAALGLPEKPLITWLPLRNGASEVLRSAGYVPLRSVAVRVDMAETLKGQRGASFTSQVSFASTLLGVDAELASRIVEELPRKRRRHKKRGQSGTPD